MGLKKVKILRENFKTIEDMFLASKEKILTLPFFGEKDFENLKAYLRKYSESQTPDK